MASFKVKAKVPVEQLVKSLSNEQSGNLLLQSRYDKYVEEAAQKGIDAEFNDMAELSRFIGVDLRNAVLRYYTDISNYKYDLDVVLFLKVAEGIVGLCEEMEHVADRVQQDFYEVDTKTLKLGLFKVEKSMKDSNGVEPPQFKKMNSIIKDIRYLSTMLIEESQVHDELRKNPIRFLKEPMQRLTSLMPNLEDVELIYSTIKAKYNLSTAPESFNELLQLLTVAFVRKGIDVHDIGIPSPPPANLKVDVWLLHVYISMLNSTHLRESIDDAEMLSRNDVPARLVEKIRDYFSALTETSHNLGWEQETQKPKPKGDDKLGYG